MTSMFTMKLFVYVFVDARVKISPITYAIFLQVIDLEGMAHHRGSAFDAIGQHEQPSNETYENRLALAVVIVHMCLTA